MWRKVNNVASTLEKASDQSSRKSSLCVLLLNDIVVHGICPGDDEFDRPLLFAQTHWPTRRDYIYTERYTISAACRCYSICASPHVQRHLTMECRRVTGHIRYQATSIGALRNVLSPRTFGRNCSTNDTCVKYTNRPSHRWSDLVFEKDTTEIEGSVEEVQEGRHEEEN